jgi:hypothetical protein
MTISNHSLNAVSSNASPGWTVPYLGDDDWVFLKEEVKTYLMAPISLLNSPTFFFVDRVLAVPPPFFARCPIFRNHSSHVENRTEPASQIPEEGWSTQSLEWERGRRGLGSNARPPVKELARWTTRPHRRPRLANLFSVLQSIVYAWGLKKSTRMEVKAGSIFFINHSILGFLVIYESFWQHGRRNTSCRKCGESKQGTGQQGENSASWESCVKAPKRNRMDTGRL